MSDARIPIDTNMSKRLKKGREAKKLTQSALATKANVPRARVKRIECMQLATIDRKEYMRLNRALGLAVMLPTRKAKETISVARYVKAKYQKAHAKPRSRKDILQRLEKVGLADLTVRELLSFAN